MTLTGLALQEGLHGSQCRKVKTFPDYKAQAAIAELNIGFNRSKERHLAVC